MAESGGEPASTQPSGPPGAGLFANPALLANPYPMYAMLRATNPVLQVPVQSYAPSYEGPGVIVLTRFAEIETVLREDRFSVDRMQADVLRLVPDGAAREFIEGPNAFRSMLTMDPPDHTRVRGLVSKAFTPRRVEERLRPRVEELVDELLAEATARNDVDVMRDFAEPLPAIVIAELLGVPADDRQKFKAWSRELIGSGPTRFADSGGRERTRQVILDFMDYMRGVVEDRRRSPGDDLISGMVLAQEEQDALSDQELISTSLLLLIAGHETTTNLIGNGLLALLRHREQLERLHAEPALVDGAVEELLRFDSPVQATVRVATEDCELGDVAIGRGALVVCVLGAANRDPAAYDAPDALDVGRTGLRHLAFGFGTHFCLGAGLARLEARTAFRELTRRFPGMQLATDDVTYRPNPLLRGVSSLPVTLDG